MVSYLQRRGIDADIISYCIGKGLLYESHQYRNCVFVGRDVSGKARYACLRGTYGTFKMDLHGSDKRYSFSIPAADAKAVTGSPSGTDMNSPYLVVAESPIDVLSITTLLKMQGEDWTKYHYLSLGGTAPLALLTFLREHPDVTHVSLCLDNDTAGLNGMKKIREAVCADMELSQRIKVVADNPPPVSCGKDYNELLQKKAAAIQKGNRAERTGQDYMSL